MNSENTFKISKIFQNPDLYQKCMYLIDYIESKGICHLLNVILYETVKHSKNNLSYFEEIGTLKKFSCPVHFSNFTYKFMMRFFEANQKNPLYTCLFFPDTEYGMVGFFMKNYLSKFQKIVDSLHENYKCSEIEFCLNEKLISNILPFMCDFTSAYCHTIYQKYISHFVKNIGIDETLTENAISSYIDDFICQLEIIENNYNKEFQGNEKFP
jgi:hypothetical protein